MRTVIPAIVITGFVWVGLAAQGPTPAAPSAGTEPQIVWSPKASAPPGWTPPHRPHTKLADLLASHKGQLDWAETMVDDDTLHADYISMAPGGRTPRRMNTDTREWWVIQDGQLRFTIDGQEPFVASKGYLVQVPYRTFYTIETVGERPSLRLEVNIAKARKMYPVSATPVAVPGVEYVRARVAGRGTYDGGNKPFVDFNAVVAGTDRTRQFVFDARGVADASSWAGNSAAQPLRQGALPHRELRVLVHPPRADSLHHRGTTHVRRGPGRHRLCAETAMASSQLRRRRHVRSPAMNGYPDLAHSFEALDTGDASR